MLLNSTEIFYQTSQFLEKSQNHGMISEHKKITEIHTNIQLKHSSKNQATQKTSSIVGVRNIHNYTHQESKENVTEGSYILCSRMITIINLDLYGT